VKEIVLQAPDEHNSSSAKCGTEDPYSNAVLCKDFNLLVGSSNIFEMRDLNLFIGGQVSSGPTIYKIDAVESIYNVTNGTYNLLW
jgi:hypothetical protein